MSGDEAMMVFARAQQVENALAEFILDHSLGLWELFDLAEDLLGEDHATVKEYKSLLDKHGFPRGF